MIDCVVDFVGCDIDELFFGFVLYELLYLLFVLLLFFDWMYDFEWFENLVKGDFEIDYMDEKIFVQNYYFWMICEGGIDDIIVWVIKEYYYGMIFEVDCCIGCLFDVVEVCDDVDNIFICFFLDYGEFFGDYCGWEKLLFFELLCCVLFFVSWFVEFLVGECCDDFVLFIDLFGIVMIVVDDQEFCDGVDVFGMIWGDVEFCE